MVIDADGVAGVYHSTAERQLLTEKVTSAVPELLVIAPRANAFLLEDNQGMIEVWTIDNEHPEVSIKSIWQEVAPGSID
jgi:phosphate transport system permease protein